MSSRLFKVIVSALLIIGISAPPAYAVVKSNDIITVAENEVIDDDFFAAGEEVIIEGTINGDVYIAAGSILVSGTVNGDVLAAGSSVDISGTVTQDVRVLANTVRLSGAQVGDSVTVAGNELRVDEDSSIGGGLVFGGRTLSIDGSVGRGVISAGQTSRLDGPIGNTVRIAADSITISDDAVISGDLEYRSDDEARILGTIEGEIIRSDAEFAIDTEGIARAISVGFTVWSFLAASVIGSLLLFLFPRALKRANMRFRKDALATAGRGAIALLISVPAVIFLMVTVIGIPLALLWLSVWIIAILLAKFFAGYAAGTYMLEAIATKKQQPRPFVAMLVGLLLYYFLRSVPLIGMFVRFLTTIVGIGMMLNLYQRSKPERPMS